MNTRTMPRTITAKTKFDSLTFSNDRLFLKYQNEPEIEIPFANLDKIYIKKYKLNPIIEFICIAFPFLFVFMFNQYLPFGLLMMVSIVTVFSVFMVAINYKWYILYIHLYDGTSLRKKISRKLKAESFSILEKVIAEHVQYNFNKNLLGLP